MNQPLPYTIRPMEPSDVPTVVAIERLSYPTPWLASSYLYELKHNTLSSYHVLLKPTTDETAFFEPRWRRWLRGAVGMPGESRVIGYMGFRFQFSKIHISTIAVHPDWRGRGLGELLLLMVLEQALELGVRTITLEVRASNQIAQNLYRKYDFQFADIHRGYYRDGEDAWLMEANVSGTGYRARLIEWRRTLEAQIRHQPASVGQNDGDTI